jgi:two-component system cell cycle response regulator
VVPLVAGDRCLGVILVQSASRQTMTPAAREAAGLEGRLAGTLLYLQFGADLASNLKRPAMSSHGQPAVAALPTLAVVPDVSRSAAVPFPGAAGSAHRCRILVGEDDADQAAAVIAILVDEGFDTEHAANGAEVLRLARRRQPDLILLDVNMPVLNGFDALGELVKDVSTRDVPILIVSGAADLLPRVRSLNLDTIDFLRKPFSLIELLARVDRSLSQAASRGHLRLEASIDDLTGLANPRYLRERLALEQSRIARYGTHSAIVMVDVDKLKDINDRYGHIVGSRILRAIGQVLRNEVRETDLAARYGGDEFVVLLPHTTAIEACTFAERVLAFLRRLRPDGVEVSLSMGVAALDPSDGQSIDRLLAQADAAAYRAKRSGGSRVCVFDEKADSLNLARDAGPTTPRL